jgi:hypothetical protein
VELNFSGLDQFVEALQVKVMEEAGLMPIEVEE